MSPRRRRRVAPPARPGCYTLRFATADAAKGWEDLCRQAPGNTRTAFEAIETDPAPQPSTGRHHRLKGGLATDTYAGKTLEQWQYEVTGAGRIWYLIDRDTLTCWIRLAGTGHPKATD
jgi:hypothetical protein